VNKVSIHQIIQSRTLLISHAQKTPTRDNITTACEQNAEMFNNETGGTYNNRFAKMVNIFSLLFRTIFYRCISSPCFRISIQNLLSNYFVSFKLLLILTEHVTDSCPLASCIRLHMLLLAIEGSAFIPSLFYGKLQ
jgi:hypothetical protein